MKRRPWARATIAPAALLGAVLGVLIALEDGVARTIGGLRNHRGGTLLVGVADGGDVVGIAPDYQSLPALRGIRLVHTAGGGSPCSIQRLTVPASPRSRSRR